MAGPTSAARAPPWTSRLRLAVNSLSRPTRSRSARDMPPTSSEFQQCTSQPACTLCFRVPGSETRSYGNIGLISGGRSGVISGGNEGAGLPEGGGAICASTALPAMTTDPTSSPNASLKRLLMFPFLLQQTMPPWNGTSRLSPYISRKTDPGAQSCGMMDIF